MTTTIPRRDDSRTLAVELCDSWKEPESASNFKTRDTNVTHMEFRRSSFYLLQRGRNNDPRIGSNGFVLLTGVKKLLFHVNLFVFQHGSCCLSRSIFTSVEEESVRNCLSDYERMYSTYCSTMTLHSLPFDFSVIR